MKTYPRLHLFMPNLGCHESPGTSLHKTSPGQDILLCPLPPSDVAWHLVTSGISYQRVRDCEELKDISARVCVPWSEIFTFLIESIGSKAVKFKTVLLILQERDFIMFLQHKTKLFEVCFCISGCFPTLSKSSILSRHLLHVLQIQLNSSTQR